MLGGVYNFVTTEHKILYKKALNVYVKIYKDDVIYGRP